MSWRPGRTPRRPERCDATRPGARGEQLAAALIRRGGLRIEARNLRTRSGEIDILARRRRLWIAVEVKSRRHHDAPERCVTPAQLQRIQRALQSLVPVLRPRPLQLRVDVVAVRLPTDDEPQVLWLPGTVWTPE